jgi:hypothetical protein
VTPAAAPAPRRFPRGELLLLAFSAAGALLFVELAARLVLAAAARPDRTVGILSAYHPLLGWVPPAGESAWLREPDFDTLLAINRDGLRGPEVPRERTGPGPRVWLAGDSFAQGYTVDEPLSARAVAEAKLRAEGCAGAEVLNAGVAGYGGDQSHLRYREQGRAFAPEVVVYLFFGNDLSDNARRRKKPFFVLEGDGLALRGVPVPEPEGERLLRPGPAPAPPPPWRGSAALEWLSRRTAAGQPALHRRLAAWGLARPWPDHGPTRQWLAFYGPPTPATEEAWAIAEAVLAAFARDVRADGRQFAIAYAPARFEMDAAEFALTRERWELAGDGWESDRVARRLLEVSGRLAIPVADLRAWLAPAVGTAREPYLASDPHWNAVGQQLAGEAIAAQVRALAASGCTAR